MKSIIIPAKIIRISTKKPINIKKNLKIAPMTRDIRLEIKISKYLPISNPFGYDKRLCLQGAKRVFKSNGIEK